MGPSDWLLLVDSGSLLFAFGQRLAKTSNEHIFRDTEIGVLTGCWINAVSDFFFFFFFFFV